MTRAIIMGTLTTALILATSGPVKAQRRSSVADTHESPAQANGISIA